MTRRIVDFILVLGFLFIGAMGLVSWASTQKVDVLVVLRFYDYRYSPPRLTIGTDAGLFECRDELVPGGRYRLTVRDHVWPTGRKYVIKSELQSK